MNIFQIHLAIQQGLQKNAVFAYQNFGTDEIDLHINLEQYEIIKDIIRDEDRPQDGYTKDTFNLIALKDIYVHKSDLGTLTNDSPTGSKSGDNKADLYIPVRVYADVQYTCDGATTSILSKCRLMSADLARDTINNILYRSVIDSPVCFINGSKIVVLSDGTFTISKIYLDYIKDFTQAKLALDINGDYDSGNSVQSILHPNLHLDLIDRTIARIKSFNEGNLNVIQRIDQKQIQN